MGPPRFARARRGARRRHPRRSTRHVPRRHLQVRKATRGVRTDTSPRFVADAFPRGKPVDEETGRQLALWAQGEEAAAARAEQARLAETQADEPPARPAAKRGLVVHRHDGGPVAVERPTQWLAAYRRIMGATEPDQSAAVAERNLDTLRSLAELAQAKAPPQIAGQFAAELEAAEALVGGASEEAAA